MSSGATHADLLMATYFLHMCICRQPTDVVESVTYTEGLTLTRSSEVSTTLGIGAALEASVSYGIVEATLSTSLNYEINKVNTAGSESSWSREVLKNKSAMEGSFASLSNFSAVEFLAARKRAILYTTIATSV